MTPTLLPLYVDPVTDPAAWQAVVEAPDPLTVVLPHPRRLDAARRLAGAGHTVLGRVDLGFTARPVADLLADVTRWADRPIDGVFLDQAPTSPFCLGPVALAIRVARRAGLRTVVLNPGVPTDPLYRELGVPVCAFEGGWAEYRRWDAEGAQPGDGHLVHSVPPAAFDSARALLRLRRAGWSLVTDRCAPDPYGGVPAWLTAAAWPGDVPAEPSRTGWG